MIKRRKYPAGMQLMLILCLTSVMNMHAQVFDRYDSIAGSLTPERTWWDLTFYELNVEVDTKNEMISATNKVFYTVLQRASKLQLELQDELKVKAVTKEGIPLDFSHENDIIYININGEDGIGTEQSVEISFAGKPKVAKNPPWEPGFTWTRDKRNNQWIVSTSQGAGAEMWWPGKHHPYDEPDSMLISVTVPKQLTAVANGKLLDIETKEKTRTFNWFVSNPINNYAVNLNIGKYVHFSDTYAGEEGLIDCDYYVLPDNLEKAIGLFPREVPRMFRAFEHWFGPYPFYDDGFKLIEVPYAGMEHQSAVTYGNQYEYGYLGRDLSNTNWGFTFDFIIIHESGHEWFANSITNKDVADMWIHESFTAYSENLFLDYHYGKLAASEYVIGTRENIRNDRPVQGIYGVNYPGSPDMYYKGANALHTLRYVVNNDTLWRQTLRGINREFYHQTVGASEIVEYLSQQLSLDLVPFFTQYFQDTRIPVFEYSHDGNTLHYRWNNTVDGFSMPVLVYINELACLLVPGKEWQSLPVDMNIDNVEADTNWYIFQQKVAD